MRPPRAVSAALCFLGALLSCSAARAQVTPQWVVLEKGGYGGAHYDAVQDLAVLTTLAVQAVHFHEFTSTGAEAGQRTLPVPAAPLESRVGGVAPLGEDYLVWWGGGVLTRVRSDGAERWRRTFYWSRSNTILGAYLDAAGDIIVWGDANCPRNPGSGCLGYYSGRLVKLTPDGVLRWEVDSSDYSTLSAVAEAPDGTYTAFGWAEVATPFNPGACAFALRVSSEGDILSHSCLLENQQHTRILGLTRLRGGDLLLIIGQSTRSFRLVTASTSGEVLSVSDPVSLSGSFGSLVLAEAEGGGLWVVGAGPRLWGLSREGEIVLEEEVPIAEGAGFQALHVSSLPGGDLLLSGRTWRSNFGEGSLVARLRLDMGTSVEGAPPVPGVALQAYPNPSPGAITVRIEVPEPTVGAVAVYDVTGRLARVLRESAPLAGSLTLSWDGLDTAGREAPPGLYLCVVSHTGGREVTKLVRL